MFHRPQRKRPWLTSRWRKNPSANGVRQCKQIWIGAISKERLASGGGLIDPSAPPMWLPGQNHRTNNISPYWTAGVPIN